MRTRHIVITILIIGLGVGAIIYFSQTEEKKVKRQFRLLAESVSKEAGENPFIMAQKIKNLQVLFEENLTIKVAAEPFSGSYTRDEVLSYATAGRTRFSDLSLKFFDFNIAFPEKGTARAMLTARLTGKSTSGEQMDETREIECALKKIEKKWRFTHIEVVEVLKK